jgi:hypothetical protein
LKRLPLLDLFSEHARSGIGESEQLARLTNPLELVDSSRLERQLGALKQMLCGG